MKENNYSFDNLPQLVAQLTKEFQDLKLVVNKLLLQDIKKDDRLGIMEVSDLTGYSRNTLYQLVHRNKIPYHKPEYGGRKLIFFQSEIDEWLRGKKNETSQEYCVRKQDELYTNSKGGMR
ncbi:helix-turn-helix transcriptional regulator [Maribellus mangrovi]|uniref:helix-turn-helix transcriptional regulator n=1 Tax=Maribellus mangrovi TaxID=3133146 RepID=UPI0030EF4B65